MQNENKTSLVTSVLALLLGLGLLLFGHGGNDAQVATQVQTLQSQVQQIIAAFPKAGALASPALGPWFSVGDVVRDGNSSNVDFTSSATSTACSIQSPAATSTIKHASIRVATEPYVNTWKIAKAATPATYTTLLAQNLAATASGVVLATTTATTLTDGIVAPLQWINFGVATTTAVNANFNATVRCEVEFLEL